MKSGGGKSCGKAEALRLEGLRRAFGKGPPAVEDFHLSVPPGAFFSLLGPSGCGKTTLLRLIGGYLRPAAGAVVLDGRDVTAEPPERRDVGMVFQNYALFPHLTARANVSFGLEMRRVPRAERLRRVEAMLDRVGLGAAERGRRPGQLSGGQQQRVALARALVIEPQLLLLDEPFANLDCGLREQLRAELRTLQRRTGVTTLLVTHDQEEALSLSDRVGVMVRGRLPQEDAPQALYNRPRNPFVARFLGDANILEVEDVTEGLLCLRGGWTLPWHSGRLAPRLAGDSRSESPTIGAGDLLMLRPEQCAVGAAAAGRRFQVTGRLTACGFLGADLTATVALTEQASLRVRFRPDAAPIAEPGAPVVIGFDAAALWRIPERDPDWLSAVSTGDA